MSREINQVPPEPKDGYARLRDPQAQRTRLELWIILAVVLVVIVGAIAWRLAGHHPAPPQSDWNRAAAPPKVGAAAAAAGVAPRPGPEPRMTTPSSSP